MDNDENKITDLSARLEEKDLPKPGEAFKPSPLTHSDGSQEPQDSQSEVVISKKNDIDHDIDDYNKFVKAQEEIPAEEAKGTNSGLHIIWEIGKTILIAAAVVFVINTFIFQAYYVSGNSMNPGYHDGDYLLINKFPSSMRNIAGFFGKKGDLELKRGDVLVFKPPENPELFYIKRVIALPGERITLNNGAFTIYNNEHPNGFILKEPYIDPRYELKTTSEEPVDRIIAPGEVFTVGDNRSPGGSHDSRAWGPLPQDNISGNAFFRLIPLSDIGLISLPEFQ